MHCKLADASSISVARPGLRGRILRGRVGGEEKAPEAWLREMPLAVRAARPGSNPPWEGGWGGEGPGGLAERDATCVRAQRDAGSRSRLGARHLGSQAKLAVE